MIPSTLTLQHERVDDIPLLLGLMEQLQLSEILEQHLGSHHLHQGLPNGTLLCGWLAFVLSQANHCKVSVQDWAQRHQHTLETQFRQPLRAVEFSDDRLSILLGRLHDCDWQALEGSLWQATCEVYEIPISCVRLDSTTTCGYHTIEPDGLMQRGHSKDHRPDLPQLKLMAAAAQPSGYLLASDLYPGNAADDPLYVPMIERVRAQLGRRGLLYAGDCKMAALGTRAELAQGQDYYLTPLPQTGEVPTLFAGWVDAVVTGEQEVAFLYQTDAQGKRQLFGAGYEVERTCTAEVKGRPHTWVERVQVVRSLSLAARQAKQLEEQVRAAEEELRGLTPPEGRGRRQYRDEASLQAAVTEVVERYGVSNYLEVNWVREERRSKRYEGRGRGSASRAWHWEVEVRYQIQTVQRREETLTQAKYRLGWRVQVTNLPPVDYALPVCVLLSNGGWSLERDFHLVKDAPLGIRPLYVREQEQIVGLTRLLMIALRVLTLFELQVRAALAAAGEELVGLYEGQPRRKTGRPTATRLLKAIARLEITVTQLTCEEGSRWYVAPLPPLLKRILELVGLSPTLYLGLAENSG